MGAGGWVEEVRRSAAGVAVPPLVDARVEVAVTDTPVGEVRCVLVVADGHVADVEVGGVAGGPPDATLTTTWKDLARIRDGDLTPSVAFMQGRLKATGDMHAVLGVLSATAAVGTGRRAV
jgi:hypothetical protein